MQSSVDNTYYASGIPGEFARSENADSFGAILDSATESYNIPGAVAVMSVTTDDNLVAVAGDGNLAGILACPKTGYRSSLDAQAYLPNDSTCEVARRGYLFVTLTTTAAIGDYVYYNSTTGVLATYDPATAPDSGYVRVPGGQVVDNTVSAAGTAVIYFDILAGDITTPAAA